MMPSAELAAPPRDLWRTAAATRPALAYALLPNALFWVLGHFVYLMRPAFNVDYLLLGVLALFLPRGLALAALALELLLDAVVNVAPAFHFELSGFLRALQDVVHLGPAYALPAALALALACAGLAALMWRTGGRIEVREAVLLLSLAAALSIADVANGSSFLPIAVKQSFTDFNIANSAAAKTLFAVVSNLRHGGRSSYAPLPEGASASAPLLAAARDASKPLPPWQLGLVQVESLGLFRDRELAAQLLAPLTSPAIQQRYQVEVGQVPFHGVTLDGEFRELCGVRLGWLGADVPECLPALLARRGYQTVALHGFTSAFYDRARWYPLIGFQQSLFAQQLRGLGLTRTCGSGFNGLCDPDVAKVFGDELRAGTASSPRFVYWMSLNSHMPLNPADADGSSFECGRSALTRGDEDLCLTARILAKALDAVATVALDPRLPPTELVVVGDHAPPTLSREHRELFDQAAVPFVRLIPR